MLKRSTRGKGRITPRVPYYPYMHTHTRPYLKRMYIGWTTRHFFIMFCLRHVLFLSLFFFLSMALTDDHGTHRFYDVSRYSQPRPHYAFPWLLDKLRWTQAIVTAVSHFLVKNRVMILTIGQHTPTKNFQEYPRETWSQVASLPVSIRLLIIRCFNDLWSIQHHYFGLRNRRKFYVCL